MLQQLPSKTQVQTDRQTMLSVAVSVFATAVVLFAVIGYISIVSSNTSVNYASTTNRNLNNYNGSDLPGWPPECPTPPVGVKCQPTATAYGELLPEAVAHAIGDCTKTVTACVTSEQQEEANFRTQCPGPKCGFFSEVQTEDCTISHCESLEFGGKTVWYCTAVGLQDITNYQCLIQA